MPVLTVVYAGQTVYNAEVQAFGYEAGPNGDITVSARVEPVDLGQYGIEGETGTKLHAEPVG